LTAATLGMTTIFTAAVATRDRAVEEWYLLRLRSADFPARVHAAESLGEMRSPRAIPGVVALLAESEGRKVEDGRYPVFAADRVALALEELGPQAIPDLARALKETSGRKEYWRRRACRVIAKAPAKDAVGPLMAFIDDGYLCVRGEAILALKKLGPEAAPAIPALKMALGDPDRNVKGWAEQALEEIEPSPSR
jgi:HEAT repeat protein